MSLDAVCNLLGVSRGTCIKQASLISVPGKVMCTVHDARLNFIHL